MSKLSTFGTITLLTGGLAFAGSTLANELENPGAEAGDLTGWTADDGVLASQATDLFGPLAGDWFFLMGEALPLGEHTAGMAQAVDVSECSNEHISGEYTVAGSVATGGDHWGTFTLDFGDGAFVVLENLQSAAAGEWMEFGPVTGLVPDVESATYSVSGTKLDPEEVEDAIQVAYDDLAFTVNCVSDFAKVSGRIGQDPQGRGRSPEWALGGAVGTLEDGELSDSGIEINYRALDSVCTFSANAIEYTSEVSVTIDADYVCEGGDKGGQEGVAAIDLTAKGESGCTAHANRDRGSIAVTADDADLDIAGEFGVTGGESCIDRGNVEIDPAEAEEDDGGEGTV